WQPGTRPKAGPRAKSEHTFTEPASCGQPRIHAARCVFKLLNKQRNTGRCRFRQAHVRVQSCGFGTMRAERLRADPALPIDCAGIASLLCRQTAARACMTMTNHTIRACRRPGTGIMTAMLAVAAVALALVAMPAMAKPAGASSH